LNLTLFIDTEHDGVLGRIEIDPDDVKHESRALPWRKGRLR
jgi:hypothetical protein